MELDLSLGRTLFVDTAPFIYFFEENPEHIDTMVAIFEAASAGRVHIVTSIVTYIELLTLPERLGRHDLAAKYRESLTNSQQVAIHPLNLQVADAAVRLRVAYRLKTPDAIQLATASVCGADYVVTNDRDWDRVHELRVVQLSR